MRVGIVGTGYVGLVSGTCFASLGHVVTCVDVIPEKVAMINRGEPPIYEKDLAPLLAAQVKEKRLTATTDVSHLAGCEVIFICVGTPPKEDGATDLSYLHAAVRSVRGIAPHAITVIKSTVPPGTTLSLGLERPVMNPEFLREGNAVYDFLHPDRIVIGAINERDANIVAQLYERLKLPSEKIIITDPTTAELIKYASNAFLATKISFINEIAGLCEKIGADVSLVARGMGLDNRIGPKFLNAGAGWGGSCFGKDIKSLLHVARTYNYHMRLLEQTVKVNYDQALHVVELLTNTFAENKIKGTRIAVLGLAFKQDTDDVRDSAALRIIRELQKEGYEIRAHDPLPKARENAQKEFATNVKGITIVSSVEDAVRDADATIIATEWDVYRTLPLTQLVKLQKHPLLVDARRLIDPENARQAGLIYVGIGYGKKPSTPTRV